MCCVEDSEVKFLVEKNGRPEITFQGENQIAASAAACDNLRLMPSCLVVMPYTDVFRGYYEDIFSPAITNAGLTPVLAETRFTVRGMIDQVVAEIRSSKIIVADITGERPNVFYEMGLSHAMGKPVIILTQNAEWVPSDLKHLRWLSYETVSARWAITLQNQLTAALKDSLAELDSETESPSSLRPASMDAIQLVGIGQRIANLSAFQRTLFDYIRSNRDGLSQEVIQVKLNVGSSELFYRLEQLRLLGLLVTQEIGRYDSGALKLSFRLSSAALAFFEHGIEAEGGRSHL